MQSIKMVLNHINFSEKLNVHPSVTLGTIQGNRKQDAVLLFSIYPILLNPKKINPIEVNTVLPGLRWVICFSGSLLQRCTGQANLLASHMCQVSYVENEVEYWESASDTLCSVLLVYLQEQYVSDWLKGARAHNWLPVLTDKHMQSGMKKALLELSLRQELFFTDLLSKPTGLLSSSINKKIEDYLLVLLEQLVLNQLPGNQGSINIDEELVLKEVTKLLKDWDKPLSVDQIKKETGLSLVRLQKVFRSLFGQTTAAFILHLRIEKAKELLVSNEESILSVSIQVGFSSLSYFSRVFKQKVGEDPRSFRKRGKGGIGSFGFGIRAE